MGMSTNVIGFKAPDDKWRKMKAIWDACEAADIDIPEEVYEYFDCREPDPAGVTVDIDYVSEWSDSDRVMSGIEISVKDLPPGLTSIRFYNSW